MPDLMYPSNLSNGSINSAIRFTEFMRISADSTTPANTITLYMPDELSCPIETEWSDGSQLKLFGNFAAMASSGIQTVTKSLTGKDSSLSTGTKKNIRKGAAVVKLATTKVKDIANTVSNVTNAVGDIASYATKTIMNPGTILLFKGVKLREVSLSFKMSPTSQKEAADINNICTTFKAGSLPATQGDIGGAGVGLLTYPNEYEIEFLYNGQKNPFMPILKRGVITECDVKYTDNGFWSMTREGAPSTCTLTLQFKELEIQTQTDYEFNAVSVGNYLNMFGKINNTIAGATTNNVINPVSNLPNTMQLNNLGF